MSQNINTVDISNDANLEDYVLVSVNGSLRRVKVADLKELVDSTEDVVVVDTELSTTSVNPVQNKVITTELNKKVNSSNMLTYQTKRDNTLTTTSKEVVGAINENTTSINQLSGGKADKSEVSQLKEDLDDYIYEKCISNYGTFLKNKFDNSGKIQNGTGYYCTNLLINSSSLLSLKIKNNTNVDLDGFYAKYDSNGNFYDRATTFSCNKNNDVKINTESPFVRITLHPLSDVELETDSLQVIGYYKDYTTKINQEYNYISKLVSNYGTVGTVGNDAQYNEIGEAYNALGRNKSALLIQPGVYSGNLSLQEVRLVGINKDICEIKYTNGEYPYASLIPRLDTYCSDLSFTTLSTPGKTPAYAMHIESPDNKDKRMIFRNCVFYSDLAPSVGIGLSKGLKIFFEDCYFTSAADSAVFFHDSIYEDKGEQFISFKDCVFESFNNSAIKIESVNVNNLLVCEFINCTAITSDKNALNCIHIKTPAESGFLCGNSVKLSSTSHGNNVELLNAF